MTTKFKSIFNPRLLLVTNLFTLIILFFILLKEGYYARFLNKFQSENTKVVAIEDLSAMNNTFQLIYKDYNDGTGSELFKILIIGNSIASHPIAENIGWTQESGMAATNINKDYPHLLLEKISKNLPNHKITMRVANFADFERNPNILINDKINNFINFKPDIILFQLGENVKKQDILLFQKKYIELINSFKKNGNNAVICTTPFFPSLRKNSMVNFVSLQTKSFLVDLSHLALLDSENYAKNERKYQADKTKWKASGIGEHPGDKGMKSIADELFITINAIIKEK